MAIEVYSWWRDYYKAVKCLILRAEIYLLLFDEVDEVEQSKIPRLINAQKFRYPDKSESWYLERVICDLRRKSFV